MAARRFTGYRGLQCLSWHGFCLPMADWSRALATRILAFGQSGLAFGVSGRASVIDILFEVEVECTYRFVLLVFTVVPVLFVLTFVYGVIEIR